ncbi:MAG: EamA family transporter [Pseudomonadota bacterium]
MTTTPYLPQLLAVVAALAFALSNHLQSAGLTGGADMRSAVLVNIATGATVYWLASPLYLEWSDFETRAALLFALVGVFRPPLSMTFSMLSIRTMGPTLASAFASTAPMFATAFGIVLLGETLTWPVAIGTALIVAGAIIATLKPAGLKRDWPIWAIGLPLLTAAMRAGAQGITKIGLEDVPNALFASLLGYSVGACVVAILFVVQGRRFTGTWMQHKWFVLAGLCSSFGILCLNTALKLGTLLTVSPIVAVSPVFALMLSVLVFRRERVTARTIGAIALVVPGVILLVVLGRTP